MMNAIMAASQQSMSSPIKREPHMSKFDRSLSFLQSLEGDRLHEQVDCLIAENNKLNQLAARLALERDKLELRLKESTCQLELAHIELKMLSEGQQTANSLLQQLT
jgi:hypothetical protein